MTAIFYRSAAARESFKPIGWLVKGMVKKERGKKTEEKEMLIAIHRRRGYNCDFIFYALRMP